MSTPTSRDRNALNAVERVLRVVVVGIAAFAALCSLVVVVSMASGARPLVFRSGSMSPAIPAGSLAFTRPADAADLAVGDVVTVKVGSGRVTHRIVAVKHHGDVALLQLKGDANKAADRTIYPVREAQRTWFSVPVAGSVTAWLSRPVGGLSLAAYLLLVVLVVGRWRRALAPNTAPSAAFMRRNRAVAGGTAVLTFAAGAFGSWVMPTWAYWTDDANASSATISTGTWDVAPPASAVTNVTPLVNAAGWYNANLTVSLTASDAAPSSGIAGIHYILDGGSEQVLPGSTGNVAITTEGTNTLEFWAVDNAGFIESPHHTATYKLDKTPPPAPAFTSTSNDTGASSTDRITSASTQTLSGTAEPLSTVTVKQGTDVLGTTTANASGVFTYGPVTLVPGANGFTASAKDVADNVSPTSTNFVVTLDGVAPNSVVISPNDSLWHNTGVWTVTATDAISGVDTISYKVGSAPTFTSTSASNGVAVSPPVLSDGINAVQAYATDVAGVSTSASPVSATIKVDTVKPVATLNLAPLSNSPWRTSGTANVTATDSTSGVDHIEYKIDSGSFTSLASGVGFSIPDGSHTVTYRAVDFAGNVSADASQSVQIDSAAPSTTVAGSQTANANGWINANTTLTFTPTDPSPGSGVANVQVRTNANGAGFGSTSTMSTSPYTTTVSTEGTTVVGYRANDVAGNAETEKTVTVKLDKTLPLAGSISYGGTTIGGYLNSGTFTLSGSDGGTAGIASGVNHYEYSLNGAAYVSGSTGTIPDGTTNTIAFRTVDNAGNVGPVTTVNPVKVDSTPPALSNPVPANGTSGASWASLSCSTRANQLCINAADGTSGLASVTVKLARTSGSPQCWAGVGTFNGNGTGCTAQAMTVVSGSQYGTTGLTAASMVAGTYTATYTATDTAGNTVTLATTFTITVAAPVLSCGSTGKKFVNISWTSISGAVSYNIYAPNGSLKANVSAPSTTYQLAVVGESGTVTVRAVDSNGVEGAASNSKTYDVGNGSNTGTCS